MASAAANFLSTCGSERGVPECSTQASPTATPHVGQGTEDTCSGVSSFFFTQKECHNIEVQNCPILNTLGISRYLLGKPLSFRVELKLTQSCRTTLRSELLTWILPLYWMKPSFLNLFMKKLTRDRVVPIIFASISCETLGSTF
jgi:hypothetical protein